MPSDPSFRPLAAVLVSLLAAVMIPIFRRRPNLREACTFVAAVTKFGLVASMLPTVLAGGVFESAPLRLAPGLSLHLRTDPFGLLFALVASSLWLLTSVYSVGYMRAGKVPIPNGLLRQLCHLSFRNHRDRFCRESADVLSLLRDLDPGDLPPGRSQAHRRSDRGRPQVPRLHLVRGTDPARRHHLEPVDRAGRRVPTRRLLGRSSRADLAGSALLLLHGGLRCEGRHHAASRLAAGSHGGADARQRVAARGRGGQGRGVWRGADRGFCLRCGSLAIHPRGCRARDRGGHDDLARVGPSARRR